MKRELLSDLAVKPADIKQRREQLNKLIGSGLKLCTSWPEGRFEFDADLPAEVQAERAGYGLYAFLDVPTTIDSINPALTELTVLIDTHPPTGERLDTITRKMDGRLDSCASGVDNTQRLREMAASH